MEYYGLLKTQSPADVIELILCANIIPQERKIFLETIGIECKELGINLINKVAQKVGYNFIDSKKIQEQKTKIKTLPYLENIWIFQANPQRYDILKMLDDQEVIKEFHWSVKQYKDSIGKGQIGLIWLSGKEAGIYAIVEITSNPEYYEETDAEKKYWHDSTGEEGKQLRVKMKLIRDLTSNPIVKETLKSKEELQNLSILKRPWAGTNFKVTAHEWALIKELIDN
jgi:predicted RNA-binding protein with PUA-like domain